EGAEHRVAPAVPQPLAQKAEKQAAGRLNVGLIGLISLFFLLYVGIEVGFGGWIFTYATTLGLTGAAAAYLTSAFWGALTVGRLLSIPIATYLRPRTVLFADLLAAMAGMLVLLLWPHSPIALWISVITFGVAIASIFPTILSFAGRRMTITGRITGLFFTGASLGGMTLPLLMGYLLETIAPIAIVWFILIDIIILLGLVGLILWQTRGEN
ncbi:MAG: MFS transporter, partial [Anaerolineae bacterium]